MNRTKIEWCDYTWNPIVGCRRGCSYCYARRIAERFSMVESWDQPVWHPERMTEPYKIKKPSIIFVGSMCDLIADIDTQAEIERVEWVIRVAAENPQHRFMFLTKKPTNYQFFKFPPNAMLGTSIERRSVNGATRLEALSDITTDAKKFISFEPLMGDINFTTQYYFDVDLVIIGAMTGQPLIPHREWFSNLQHPNIFYKENIRSFFPDLPKGNKQQIWSV